MANVKAVGTENFEGEVLKSSLPIMVDFWAPWCGPCKMLSPTVDTLADENSAAIGVVKVNVDENQNLAAQYGVRGIPTLIFFNNGAEVERIVGAQSKAQLQKVIDKVTGK